MALHANVEPHGHGRGVYLTLYGREAYISGRTRQGSAVIIADGKLTKERIPIDEVTFRKVRNTI